MSRDKVKYSDAELQEFKAIIMEKLQEAKAEQAEATKRLKLTNEMMANSRVQSPEESCEVEEQEQLNYLILHQQKFIKYLEAALIRIGNGTYGVCASTGKLINKDRLKLVPHTTHSIEAKNQRKSI